MSFPLSFSLTTGCPPSFLRACFLCRPLFLCVSLPSPSVSASSWLESNWEPQVSPLCYPNDCNQNIVSSCFAPPPPRREQQRSHSRRGARLEEALAEKSGHVNEGLAEGHRTLQLVCSAGHCFFHCPYLSHTFVYVLKEKP